MFCDFHATYAFDTSQNRVVVRRGGSFATRRCRTGVDPSPEASACPGRHRRRLTPRNDAVEQWIFCVNFLAFAFPEHRSKLVRMSVNAVHLAWRRHHSRDWATDSRRSRSPAHQQWSTNIP
jgi:hypothetical protein